MNLQAWLARHALAPAEVDCVIAVMLKILDGKCRMDATEKPIMVALYRGLQQRNGACLGADMHTLIAEAGDTPDERMRLRIYEQRVLAETRISRPVMKAFKARLRQTGLLPVLAAQG